MMKDGLADAAGSAAPGAGVVSARDIAEILADVSIAPRRSIRAGRALPVLQ